MGINRNYLGMIERRENSPTVDMLERCLVTEAGFPLKLL